MTVGTFNSSIFGLEEFNQRLQIETTHRSNGCRFLKMTQKDPAIG